MSLSRPGRFICELIRDWFLGLNCFVLTRVQEWFRRRFCSEASSTTRASCGRRQTRLVRTEPASSTTIGRWEPTCSCSSSLARSCRSGSSACLSGDIDRFPCLREWLCRARPVVYPGPRSSRLRRKMWRQAMKLRKRRKRGADEISFIICEYVCVLSSELFACRIRVLLQLRGVLWWTPSEWTVYNALYEFV